MNASSQTTRAKTASACSNQALCRSDAALRLERVRRIGELCRDPAVRFLRLLRVALHVVRVREQDQKRVGRQHRIALADFVLKLAGNLRRLTVLDSQLVEAEAC